VNVDVICHENSTQMRMNFWSLFSERIEALESAIVANDSKALSAIVNELATELLAHNPYLNLNVGGDPFRLSILSLPGAEQLADDFVGNAPRFENWQILADLPAYDPLKTVRISDDMGESLNIQYADLDVRVLQAKDNLVTVILSLDREFDPTGAQSHLYNAVAENVIFTILGGWPNTLSKVVLLPRDQTGKLQSLDTLREQWLELVGPTKSA